MVYYSTGKGWASPHEPEGTVEGVAFRRWASTRGWLSLVYSYVFAQEHLSGEFRISIRSHTTVESDPYAVELSKRFSPGTHIRLRVDPAHPNRSIAELQVSPAGSRLNRGDPKDTWKLLKLGFLSAVLIMCDFFLMSRVNNLLVQIVLWWVVIGLIILIYRYSQTRT